MSEQIPWNLISAIVGVVTGFLLSQVTEVWKNKRKKDTIKKALLNELKVVRETISEAQKRGNAVPMEKFPFITETYDSIKVELASILKPNQLAVLQRTYEEIKKLNLPLERSSSGYIQTVGSTDYIYIENALEKVSKLVETTINQLS